MDRFLTALRTDTGERRRLERISVHGASVRVQAEGHDGVAALTDLSSGGAAITCNWRLPAGTSLVITLPHAGGPVSGRVIRSDTSRMAVVFDADPENPARIDRAMLALRRIAQAA